MSARKSVNLSGLFDYHDYIRGKKYFEQDRVVELLVGQDTGTEVYLKSTVEGQGDLYHQNIQISGLQGGSGLAVRGDCSCYVASNCKHVIAATLKYFRDHHQEKKRGILWLDKLAQAATQACKPANAAREDRGYVEVVAYILKPYVRVGVLSAHCLAVRALNKGGMGWRSHVSFESFEDKYRLPDYATLEDMQIAQLMRVHNRNAVSHEMVISGETGTLALKKMIDTGRCFWGSVDSAPLAWGSPRKVQYRWLQAKNGGAELDIQVLPSGVALDTVPPGYLDIGDGLAGPLCGVEVTETQWSMLLTAPVIEPEAVTEFSMHLVSKSLAMPLPPPQPIDRVTVHEPMVPSLLLYAETGEDGRTSHYIRMRYNYGDHEVKARPRAKTTAMPRPQRKQRGGRLYIIERDLANEDRALAEIQALGFRLRDRGEDHVFMSVYYEDRDQAVARWRHFLVELLPQLRNRGWLVDVDDGFSLNFTKVQDWDVHLQGRYDWFDMSFDLSIGDRKVPLLPLVAAVLENEDPSRLPETLLLAVDDNTYVEVAAKNIQPVINILYELHVRPVFDNQGALRLNRFDAARLSELDESCQRLRWHGGERLRELGRKLKDFKGIDEVAAPAGLKARLRDYQKAGLNWLQFLREYQFGGVLADDMGLGKTVQALAHLLLEKENGRLTRPCLVVAPTSLMSNWKREAAVFTPDLSVLVLQGADRRKRFELIPRYDLVLSTYPLLSRDAEVLCRYEYHYVILDEAQLIKNPKSKSSRVIRTLKADHRLCLTGTPMENHLGELWALFDFLMPGFLGEPAFFNRFFRAPIENDADEEKRRALARRISPFLLRRTKNEVATELPSKTHIVRSVALQKKQAALYESVRLAMEKRVRAAIARQGLARSHITVLDALLKLRQVCCDPSLLSLDEAKKVNESAKLTMLMDLLPNLVAEGRRILLFSQFTSMLAIIEKRLQAASLYYCKLTGRTRNRDQVIRRFRDGEAAVFLISLKAGGVGLNLTEADTVIHYDPWWNPAVENQATDRAHRIGQDKPVFVYKLITENTVEEKIMAMQADKQALAEGVYGAGGQKEAGIDMGTLESLLSPLAG